MMTNNEQFFLYKLLLDELVEKDNIKVLIQKKLHPKMSFNTFPGICSYKISMCKQMSLIPHLTHLEHAGKLLLGHRSINKALLPRA